jgi:hypothetical protein
MNSCSGNPVFWADTEHVMTVISSQLCQPLNNDTNCRSLLKVPHTVYTLTQNENYPKFNYINKIVYSAVYIW